MTESTTKRRIWIRNAIIIILLVLLVLTLFSNTILNHSLPEVAVQYPQYASIASRIRATGVVEANQSYTVSIEQSRVVESIAVRVGQSVAKGDVLMKLEAGDSRELDEARLALSNLELELIRKKQEDPALTADAAKDTYQALLSELNDAKATLALIQTELADIKAQQAKIPTYDEIQNAKIVMSQAQSMVDYYTAEIARLGGKQGTLGGNGYYTAEEIADLLTQAQSAYDAAQKVYGEAALAYAQADADAKTWKARLEDAQMAVDAAKAAVTDYESKRPGSVTAETVRQKKAEYDNLKAELEQKERYFTEDRYQEAKKAYDAARAEYDAKKNSASAEDLAALKAAVEAAAKALEPLESEYRALLQLRQSVYTAEQQYNTLVMQYMQSMQSDIMLGRLNGAVKQAEADAETIRVSLRDAEMVLEQCRAQYEQAESTAKQAEADLKQIQKYQSYEELGEEIKELTQKKNDLEKQMRDAQALIDSGSDEGVRQIQTRVNEKNREITAQTKVINDLEKQVAAAKANADGTSDTAQLNRKQYEIEVKRIEDQIAKQEKEIARLEKISVQSELTSPVAGVIESISALVGKTAEANAALMTITVSDMGYTVKCTVTAEQAAKVKVGDEAALQWYYWGEAPTARVVSIKSDAASQGKNKIITLSVTGEVSPGTSITFTMGDKNASYDCVVPNSAVREDADGKFVLIVSAKSTPLGNRYTAKRVPVEVIASDDTNSALSGAVSGQYVITTSASPISDGMQVRLSENNG
jgi:multidrug efflux pump subunit AcrA (membrane-fusion protein)